MANTSTIHIKTDFDCKVFDYGQELGCTKADIYCNYELRKGEHELTFALAEDESVFKTISYLVECVDCDYQFIVAIANELCDKAKEYYNSENYSSAYTLFVLAAEKGYAEAQNGLGLCYLNGHGIKENIADAWKWIKKAAEQEHVDAQYNYGILWSYEASYGGLDEAAKWWSKAAEQGHTKAQFELGHYYLKIEWSPIKALEWLSKAAEQGDKEAQRELISCYYKLGSCYEEGNGVEEDLDKAVEWYTKAAEQGNVNAQYWLGNWYRNFNYVKAIEWYTKVAEQGVDINWELWSCYDDLGHFCEISAIDRKHLIKDIELLTKIAEQGYANAQCSLGYCYEYGKNVEKNLIKAVDWYTKAAEQGHARAQYHLGLCYGKESGVEKNLGKAIEWISKAAQQKHGNAQYVLAQCYYYGEGIDKDISKALEWYNKAAENNCAEAQYQLGFCYENGIGIEKDLTKAIEWYIKAAKQGNEDAKERMEIINGQNKKESIYYLFFDTETTGLFVDEKQTFDLHHSFFKHDLRFQMMKQPHMVQLSWITTDKDCNIISQHDYIIQPKGFSIPPEATRIHGITTEIAKEKGTPIKEVIEKFMEDVYAANTLVGHNIEFDKKVINTELIRLRLNNEYDDMNSYDFMSKESICTMKESILFCEIPSRNYYHPYKQPKLQELHKKLFGCEFEDAHNSMSDVAATLKCFKEMRKRGLI